MRSRVLVLLPCCLMLAGCSAGESAAPSAAPTTTAPQAPSPTTSKPTFGTTAIPSAPLRLTGEMTRPGARLQFGEKAIVPVRHYYPLLKTYAEGVLGIVVQRIRTAPGSKVQGNFDDDDRAMLKRHIAYYAKITVTNESGNAFSPGTPRFNGEFGDFGPAVTMVGEKGLPGCREGNPPDSDEFGRKGAEWKTCLLGVSSRSRPMTEVQYHDPPYGKETQFEDDPSPDFNKHYNLGPITWS
ncbi:hypothetical protein E1287_29750 [Actinomadura sp. KC06]|uniref:hypothetical protein n=1 Tax=Actinomadura sp. KC06 TaxID=2530369 RepID=UPI00104FAF96|nr:hypothetical protein [Actinomadura sp. KC06]TDD30161.1 hypothetical protein E1287_29750 [Actinomadura sp. KC06]